MKIIIDKVLVGFADMYRRIYLHKHPDVKDIHIDIIAAGMLETLRNSGDVDGYEDDDGNLIWNVTPKFLAETGFKPGPPTVLARYDEH